MCIVKGEFGEMVRPMDWMGYKYQFLGKRQMDIHLTSINIYTWKIRGQFEENIYVENTGNGGNIYKICGILWILNQNSPGQRPMAC